MAVTTVTTVTTRVVTFVTGHNACCHNGHYAGSDRCDHQTTRRNFARGRFVALPEKGAKRALKGAMCPRSIILQGSELDRNTKIKLSPPR